MLWFLGILALALGLAPLLVGDIVARLYVVPLAGVLFLLADVFLLKTKRQRLLRLSGFTTAGLGLALIVTAVGLGTSTFAYLTVITGVIVMGAGYVFVRLAATVQVEGG